MVCECSLSTCQYVKPRKLRRVKNLIKWLISHNYSLPLPELKMVSPAATFITLRVQREQKLFYFFQITERIVILFVAIASQEEVQGKGIVCVLFFLWNCIDVIRWEFNATPVAMQPRSFPYLSSLYEIHCDYLGGFLCNIAQKIKMCILLAINIQPF